MISFDGSIYTKSAIENACADYKSLADIFMTEKDGCFYCEIKNPQGDYDLISKEFCNYVLNLTVMIGGTKS